MRTNRYKNKKQSKRNLATKKRIEAHEDAVLENRLAQESAIAENRLAQENAIAEKRRARGKYLAHSIHQENNIKKKMNTFRIPHVFGRRPTTLTHRAHHHKHKNQNHMINDFTKSSEKSHHSFDPQNHQEATIKQLHNRNRLIQGKLRHALKPKQTSRHSHDRKNVAVHDF
jgi:hypothetical protein